MQTGKSDILGSFHPTVPNDRDLLIRETSLDTLRFIFKLAEQGYQLQLSVKEQVERKATSMIGFAGLAVTIETSILSELGRQTKSTFIDKFTVGVFVASLSLIIASCVCSFLVTRVYSYSSPDIARLCDLEEMRRDEIIVVGKSINALLQATSDNSSSNSRKSQLLHRAYILFIAGFLILMANVIWFWTERILH